MPPGAARGRMNANFEIAQACLGSPVEHRTCSVCELLQAPWASSTWCAAVEVIAIYGHRASPGVEGEEDGRRLTGIRERCLVLRRTSLIGRPQGARARGGRGPDLTGTEGYEARLAQEVENFTEVENVHDLPPIHDYWAVRYCLPLLEELGYPSLDAVWDKHVGDVCRRRAPEPARLVGLGAGNGDIELGMARRLAETGVHNLELVLLELNPRMLERARAGAQALGMADRLTTVEADLNSWTADRAADVYFASHSLHHVVELEHLFDEVKTSLRPDGLLLVNDMIGRNGHQRWPEAADLVNRIWAKIPERYRHNPIHQRVDEVYPDVDHSTEGFEGIRAQDILPLLLDRFHPEAFITFMNVIDPFVDRVYGRNLDAERAEDQRFINLVAQLDDAALDLGLVTPTHLVGSFRVQPCETRFPRGRSPERVLRRDPQVEDDSARLSRLESLLEDKQHELATLRAKHETLRSRRAVRAALRFADFLRHPIRSRSW